MKAKKKGKKERKNATQDSAENAESKRALYIKETLNKSNFLYKLLIKSKVPY